MNSRIVTVVALFQDQYVDIDSLASELVHAGGTPIATAGNSELEFKGAAEVAAALTLAVGSGTALARAIVPILAAWLHRPGSRSLTISVGAGGQVQNQVTLEAAGMTPEDFQDTVAALSASLLDEL